MPPRKIKASNQRDTRHENGLAQPGKRVSKKQSNGQLDGQPNGKPGSSVPPPALPTTGLNQGLRFPRPADSADTAPQTTPKDDAAATEGAPRDRTASETSVEEVGADMADNGHEAASAVPSAEAQSHTPPCGSSSPPTGTPLAGVSTILTYYPLRDAISILILLLSLPPTLVLVIQSLFASLTFVPPTAGISISTWPNIKEMFNASNFGYPAMATILIVDFIFWAFWLPLWKPVQNIFLDFSQAVIAVSLSGAAASTGGPTYSIATSTLVVCIVHVLRYKAIHLTALDYLRSVIHKMDLGVQLDVPPFASSFFSPPPIERGWPFTVIRTILGIHIVSQGVTTCIRRSLVKANERDQSLPAITKSDPETAAGAEPSSRSATISEGSQIPHTASSIDVRPPVPSPSQREGKARESSSKKKKKQANQVRSQQPLWAAIASTKVTFVKEMEQRDAADDARDAAAMYTNKTPDFISTIYPTTNRLWISEVRDTEIYFSVGLSPEAATQSAERMEQGMSVNPGIDKSKPFFVRVNGAAWSSTRIMSSATGDDAEGKPSFDGEIFGLAPRSNYLCDIVGIAAGEVLCSVRFTTQAAPSAEQAAAAPSQPQHPALRPSSPITTLKQSIQSAEGKLAEVRNRTRKSKRDQRGAVSDIRKEINALRSKLDSSGLDDKQERRIMQITQHKNQAEEATADLKREIDAFGDVPEDEVAQSVTKRSTWQNAMNAKRRAEKDLDSAKAEAERELYALKSDIEAAKSKRERMASRHVQKAQELDKLATKQHADTTAQQHREHERTQVLQRREAEDVQFGFTISTMEAEANTFAAKAHEAYQQLAALQSWNTAPPAYPGYSSPPTPEGTLPGTNGSLGSLSPQTNGFPTYTGPHQTFQSPFHSAQPSMSHSNSQGPRGRSSSMLSQYSGFTDAGEEYVFPTEPRHQYPWPMQQQQQQPQQPSHIAASGGAVAANTMFEDRKESEASSGSLTNGSTGSNSPRPNAKVFVPGAASSKIGTIGPPGKGREKVVPQSPPGAIGSGR
ncbi:hypothetical protein B0A55_12307 [Friedmanniomyces simplex]|uniref:Ubiquitination network signaling protein acrB n=1 Tax=Friedmanniomyces simplex TaxID=329884 RepID=A0A4U0WHJ9_9PEZI|nr:hypothetical protein B0A55_12307 [Friedmanniomyces simplex]